MEEICLMETITYRPIEERDYLSVGEIINQAFELLGDEIAVVHCKDYVVEGNELKSIAAGTGSLNYPLLLKKIKEHKPYVHCTLENTVPENAAATKEFMEKTYASV